MIRSPINMSDWIPGTESFDNQDPGAFTGFGTFSTDPQSGGVIDSRGAFNPAFNGQAPHPMFEAETDAFRSALPALARKAKSGDANAAIAYQSFYGSLASKKKIYDLAYSTGLNDKNSVDIMNHVMNTVTEDKFGSGTDQFRTERVRYLARQAQRRGVNAEDLFASEQMMDDSFRSSFLSSLSSATGVTRAGGLKELYGASDGMMANAGLFLKKGLSEWEAKNGLRNDQMRTAIMSRAAEYYAKCLSNPGLRPLAGDALSIIDAAAGDAGATGGVRKPNRFDDYTRAVNGLDRGFISYTGNPDGDRASGYGIDGDRDGRTAAFWAVRDAYERGFGANVAARRPARKFDETTRKQLVDDLKANLREVSPRAASMEGYDGMIDAFARDIVKSGDEKGGINLNELSMKYYRGFRIPEEAKVEQALGYRTDLQNFARDMVNWGIDERPLWRRKFDVTQVNSMAQPILLPSSEFEDQYVPAKVQEHVHTELARLLEKPELASLKENGKFLDMLESTVSGYILNANNRADKYSATGNIDEYRQGILDRVNLLYMAEEAKRRGVNLDGWSPNVVGEDYEVRGNTDANLRGMYAQFAERIGNRLKELGEDTSGMHGAELHNWHFLHNLQKGLGFLMKSGGDYSADSFEGKRAADYRKLFESYAGFDMAAARNAANGAVAIDRGKTIRDLAVPTQGLSKEAAALSVLTEDMFSDTLNPVMAERAKRFSAIKLNGADYRNLDSNTKKLLADRYHLGVMTLMKQVMRAHPELPMSAWSDDDMLFKQLDAVSAPLFERAGRMSAALGAAKQAELDQATMRRVRGSLLLGKEKEKAGLGS